MSREQALRDYFRSLTSCRCVVRFLQEVFMANSAGLAVPSALSMASAEEIKHDHQAYSLLHWGFSALPIIAGVDKFTHFLCDWTMYLAPQIGQVLGPQNTMHAVGVIEIVAGLG